MRAGTFRRNLPPNQGILPGCAPPVRDWCSGPSWSPWGLCPLSPALSVSRCLPDRATARATPAERRQGSCGTNVAKLAPVRKAKCLVSALEAELLHEPVGVEGGAHFDVVVEITINIPARAAAHLLANALCVPRFAATLPAAYPVRPATQGGLRVATRVKLFVAVQTQIHEVGGDVLEIGPFPGGVRHHQRDVMTAQLRDEFRCGETRVAYLDRMSQPPWCIDAQ